VPQEDIPALMDQGVARVFLSGTPIAEIVDYLRAHTS
jgi:methylmalonyl-CoA mutase cobalamin-binding subunit